MHTPKYMNIVEWTIKQITSGTFSPGDRFHSEAMLGQKFGFSRQTVRRALEALEQEGYITRKQGSGSYISSTLPLARRSSALPAASSMTVGIISTHLDDYIFPGIIRGIAGVLAADGFAVQLASTNNLVAGESRALHLMLENHLAGLIVEPTKSGLPCFNLHLYHAIAQRGIPLVFIDSCHPEVSAPYVAMDDEQAGYIATAHLIAMGHKHIAGVFSHSNRQGHMRYLGYAKALVAHGFSIDEERVHWYSKENMEEILHGSRLLASLLTCTAALCFNDQLALVLLDLFKKNGWHVPSDLSLVGIDDSELAKMNGLTSIVHPVERLGETSAKLLLSMIHGAAGKNILLPPQLITRGSVAKLEG